MICLFEAIALRNMCNSLFAKKLTPPLTGHNARLEFNHAKNNFSQTNYTQFGGNNQLKLPLKADAAILDVSLLDTRIYP